MESTVYATGALHINASCCFKTITYLCIGKKFYHELFNVTESSLTVCLKKNLFKLMLCSPICQGLGTG